jgi:hypothetical protein
MKFTSKWKLHFFLIGIKPGLGVDLVKGSGPGSHGLNLVNTF